MEKIKEFFKLFDEDFTNVGKVKKEVPDIFEKYSVYPDSINYIDDSIVFMVLLDGQKRLIICNRSKPYEEFHGTETAIGKSSIKVCELSDENGKILRKYFPFTSPVSHKKSDMTMGLGDRLGLASAGHLRLIKDKKVFPVLAQQSIRELNLTGRTYGDVLSAASWAVFQEGYTKGFGADGDHLKTAVEVKMALDFGFTMITLDCSEHIDNGIPRLSDQQADDLYHQLPAETRNSLEAKYLGRTFDLGGGISIEYTVREFRRIVLTYIKAINYTIKIYNEVIKNCGRSIDFEMSIDETLTSTSPESHYLVASELLAGSVEITSLAPRFCGEFQKGIDYIGDVAQFEQELNSHVKIAEFFGYKISVHSGSDKFTVFPIIGRLTGGKYHLKTAGTNWLEAVRIIAAKEPALYRRMHDFALQNLSEAKKYYHITENIDNIPGISTLEDEALPGLMDMNDSRQVLHVTYGLILQARNPDGSLMFKDDIYNALNKYETDFYKGLGKHIGKHLYYLNID